MIWYLKLSTDHSKCSCHSLDAGAKSIHVIIKFEGCSVKFIKVKDDGHGIQVSLTRVHFPFYSKLDSC